MADEPNEVNIDTGEIQFPHDVWSHQKAVAALYRALAMAQQKLNRVVKDAKGHHGKYASLTACIGSVVEAFEDTGLSFIFVSHNCESGADIELVILHSHGAMLSLGHVRVPQAQNTPASRGAAITYAKRYALGLLGLQTSEDAESDEKHLHGEASISPAEIALAFSGCQDIHQIGETLNRLARTYPSQRPTLQSAATERKKALTLGSSSSTTDNGEMTDD